MSSVWMFLGGERKDDNKQRIVMGQRGESNRMIKYMGCLFVMSPFLFFKDAPNDDGTTLLPLLNRSWERMCLG